MTADVRSILIAVAVLAALAGAAFAQAAEAEVLFRQGKKLLKDGKIAEACEKLDASERLESSVGTLLNLADCREQNHQLATAWAVFRKAAAAAKSARDGKREAEARRRGKLLEQRLSYLTIRVPKASRIEGLTITRNGVALDPMVWNQRMPLDEGAYELSATAENHATWTKRVVLGKEAESVDVEVPLLEETPAPPAAQPPAAKVTRDETSEEPPESSRWTVTRGFAVAAAVLGAGGIGVGVTFGVRGKRLQDLSDATCPTTECDDETALAQNRDARRNATYANIGFAVGGGLLAASIVLWLVGAPDDVTPVVGPDQVGIAIGRRF